MWKPGFGALADDELGRAATDVDHQSRVRALAAGRRPQVGETGLLVAVDGQGSQREALAQLGDEHASVLGVSDRAGRDRDRFVGLELGRQREVVADHLADVVDRLVGEPIRGVDPAAEPRHRGAALDLGQPAGAVEVGDEQASGVGAHVDHRGRASRRDPTTAARWVRGTSTRPLIRMQASRSSSVPRPLPSRVASPRQAG